ncbi:putative PGG domain-containing protein [Helianthus annuus]|nr:putative PGG domain-containing protein [Helianthus annuus]
MAKPHSTLDTAEKFGRSEIAIILQKHGVPKARSIKNTQPPLTPTTRELKQTVSDIKHGVDVQLEHAIRTQKRVKGIGKRINKMHLEGLNNAINSTTIVAVLIATMMMIRKKIPNGFSLGEGNIAANPEFIVFLIFVSLALFISLAVVVVQTSIVVVEKRAKKQVMAVINKLMLLACVFVSVAFLALSFIVVGNEKWLAVGVTVIGSVTLASTLGTMYYWIITHRMEAKSIKSRRMSGSVSISPLSDSENEDFRKLYAI